MYLVVLKQFCGGKKEKEKIALDDTKHCYREVEKHMTQNKAFGIKSDDPDVRQTISADHRGTSKFLLASNYVSKESYPNC